MSDVHPGSWADRLGSALEALDRELARSDHPMAPGNAHGKAGPDVSDGMIDELAGQVGITLPHEAKALWQWRNGTSGSPPNALPGDLSMYSIEFAVKMHRFQQENFPYEDIPEMRPTWFGAFTAPQVVYVMHTEVAADGPVPVTMAFTHDALDAEVVANNTAPSITSIIEDMTMLLANDIWRVDPATGMYDMRTNDRPRLPWFD